MASFAQTLLTYTVDTINYQNIVDTACDIAGATYAVFNVFEENGKEFTSVAFSGMTPEVQSATSMLGVHFPGQKWPYDALRKVGNKKTNIFHTINQLTYLYLPKEIVDHFALQFKVNQLVEVKIEKQGRMLGYLTFIFTNGQQFKSQSIIETYADMTGMLLDRLNQEFETKREYAKFKQITSQITDIVWRTDLQFNNTYISESVERILGFGVEEYKNAPIDKRYPQGVLQDFEQIFKEELEKESQPDVDKNRTRIIEIKHYKADNSILPMEVHLSFIRDAEGVPVGIQGVSRDILERKQEEVKVKESIQCMDVSMEMANMAWWKMELPSGKVDFSPRKAQMLGYSPERFNHYTDFTSIIHPDDYHHTMSIMHMYIVGLIDKYEVEYRILTKSGEYKWFLDIGSVIEKDTVSNKMIIRGVVLDVTERKLSEEKLRESETNFRSFFETMSDLIIIANAKGDIFYANPSVSRMLGYSSEELNKMNVLDVHPFENRTQAEVVFNEIFEEKRNSCPYPMVKKDGMIFPVETRIWFGKWDGKDCAFGLSKDLSKEQEALQKFTALFENNPSLMAVTTISDGKFIEVNSTFLKVLGYTKEEVVDKSSSDLSLFIEPLQHQEVIVALFNHSKVEDIELQVRTKEGRVLTGLFSGTIIENQGVKYFLSVMVDITERKALEEDIKHQNQFRKLLMEIASDFINIPLEKVDLAIQNALEDLGGFVYADRAYTFDYDWEQNVCDNTYEWCAEGITPEIENLQHLPLSIMMEWVETHKKGEPFFVPNVSKLPSGVGKETLEKQGIKSFVTVPMMNDNHCVGFVGFDSVIEHHEYSSTEVQLLQVFAQVMANVKMRKEMFGELEMEMKKTEESETKLKESQTLAKLGGWEFDVHKGVFKFNDNFYAMFHTNANEMDGYELTPDEYAERFLFADDCQLVAEEMEKAMTTNNPDFSSYLEHRIRYFDGGIGYLGVKYYVVKDENGDTIKTYGVNQDITEKKLLELDLIATKDKAEESNRLKTAFINNISHEIRTPLNGILGISGVMIDEAIPMSEKLEFHHHLEQSTNRLLQTITDIIDISELNAGTISPQKVEVQTVIIIRNQIEKFRERCIYKQIELKDQIPVGYEHLTVYTSQELLT